MMAVACQSRPAAAVSCGSEPSQSGRVACCGAGPAAVAAVEELARVLEVSAVQLREAGLHHHHRSGAWPLAPCCQLTAASFLLWLDVGHGISLAAAAAPALPLHLHNRHRAGSPRHAVPTLQGVAVLGALHSRPVT